MLTAGREIGGPFRRVKAFVRLGAAFVHRRAEIDCTEAPAGLVLIAPSAFAPALYFRVKGWF
ncbi:hypothetical protein [Methylobacterium oryzisoli]|uniref:hypothetical protein n=1 Tax=Methylobacterium oryzisoli TaxID=3385502 RepID=UPI003892B9EA